MPLNLTREVIALFGVRAGSIGIGMLSVAMCARLLQPADFGTYSVVVALLMVLVIPSTVALRQTIAREVAQADPGDFAALKHVWPIAIRVTLVTGIGACAVLIIGAIFFGLNEGQKSTLLTCIALIFALPISYIASSALHGSGLPAISQALDLGLRPLLMVLLLAFAWFFWGSDQFSIGLVLQVYLLSVVLQGALSIALMRAKTSVPLSVRRSGAPQDLREFWQSIFAFGMLAGVTLINNSLDLFMLSALSDENAPGHYRAATALAGLVSFGVVAASAVLMPKVVALHKSGEAAALQRIVSQAALLGSGLAVVVAVTLTLFDETLVTLIFGEPYLPSIEPLQILIVGHVISALCGPVVMVLNMTGHERDTLMGIGAGTMVNVILNFALIPHYGAVGAAIASVASLVVWNLSLTVLLRRRTGITSWAGRWT